MRKKCKKNGFSLSEMIVVVAIVALLTMLGLPAIHSLQKSFESGSSIIATIDAALSTARAIAAREQRYAGVRFELDLHDNQYMIFIIHDPEKTNLSNGFRALEGQKPIKLPGDFRVIDLAQRMSSDPSSSFSTPRLSLIKLTMYNSEILDSPDGQNRIIRDTSCFSVVFSPTGKLVIHEVRVRNRDGIYQPDNSISGKVSMDDIFNSPENIINYNAGMFLQDDDFPGYTGLSGPGCLGAEYSRGRFYIYEKSYFDKFPDSNRFGDAVKKYEYLLNLEPVFINQYTGTIVNSKK